MDTAVRLSREVRYEPARLTWVASVTACLRALDLDVDLVDTAGASGYAFVLNVHDVVCPSGPTAFDPGLLLPGVQALGRSTLCYRPGDWTRSEEEAVDPDHLHFLLDLLRREIGADRPCVLWGARVPEYVVVTGVEDGRLLARSYEEGHPPIPLGELRAPGGPLVLAFPTPARVSPGVADRYAVRHAAHLLYRRSPDPLYDFGLPAYDRWIAALRSETAVAGGHGYCARCYAEGRGFAREFLQRVLDRGRGPDRPLRRAVRAYEEAEDALGRLAARSPFPAEGVIEDPEAIADAVECLAEARDAERRAAEALAEAAAAWT